jgi:N-acetyl-alpha-D-glucosaminyl L-malate synthase BshA
MEVFNIRKDIEVIPNFVPFKLDNIRFDNKLRRSFADDDEFIITHISNFRPLKRITDIIPIAKKLSKKIKFKILMVGDGPERYLAEEQCRKENLCPQVLFLGKQENISELLSISSLTLIPSSSESFGLVALESMACGIPCISTNAGGLPEVNRNGETGITIDVGDIDGFAEAILNILSDKELAQKMGENGKEIARALFSAEIIIPKYVQYYEKILSEK